MFKPWFIGRYLDPLTWLNEALFGLVMALSFTLGASLVVAEGANATRELLVAVIGCNLAWGLIDGGIFLMSNLCERSRKARLLAQVHTAPDEATALALVAGELDERLAALGTEQDRTKLYRALLPRLSRLPAERMRVTLPDFMGALATFVLVALTTIPAVVPFLLIDDRLLALRVSNGVLVALLFVIGFAWARTSNANPWLFGSAFLLAGITMVLTAIALGG